VDGRWRPVNKPAPEQRRFLIRPAFLSSGGARGGEAPVICPDMTTCFSHGALARFGPRLGEVRIARLRFRCFRPFMEHLSGVALGISFPVASFAGPLTISGALSVPRLFIIS